MADSSAWHTPTMKPHCAAPVRILAVLLVSSVTLGIRLIRHGIGLDPHAGRRLEAFDT